MDLEHYNRLLLLRFEERLRENGIGPRFRQIFYGYLQSAMMFVMEQDLPVVQPVQPPKEQE